MEKYHANGVTIYPTIPSSQNTSRIMYNGLLYQNGATEVYAHIGYGRRWENQQDYKMRKTPHGFETSVPVPYTDTLNICFKDAANNWDNNAGANYSFFVAPPPQPDNTSFEAAEEVGVWNNVRTRCRAAFSRWFGE
ncbi:Hypothetical protein LUCI_2195 [Lucifera butyrica]|uniref:Carbohydrate binding module family 25 domain-containing protein n=1 Tax=Lucifera butyrica TaxID=1351585 RepID=A0A498R9Z1_9FIRM|nr:carbohydrate-binding protein [Lucifera butyrica]VBB06953.1 Hypothetical protein LUCI_2195 [Lucifera butyrica]